jgi:pyruvate dehydrogenase (quinone)
LGVQGAVEEHPLDPLVVVEVLDVPQVGHSDANPRVQVGGAVPGHLEVVRRCPETMAAPIVKTLSGKATVPDDSPYTTGGIGLLGTRPSEELMEQIDTLLMVGTNFPYTKHLPAPGKVRVAQIAADPARAGGRIATEAPVVGDARLALQGLLPLLKHRTDTSFLEQCRGQMRKWRENMAALADPGRDPIAPQYVVSVLDELAADDAVLTCDSGTIATWAARHWDIRSGREFFLSGNLAAMAPGLPTPSASSMPSPAGR